MQNFPRISGRSKIPENPLAKTRKAFARQRSPFVSGWKKSIFLKRTIDNNVPDGANCWTIFQLRGSSCQKTWRVTCSHTKLRNHIPESLPQVWNERHCDWNQVSTPTFSRSHLLLILTWHPPGPSSADVYSCISCLFIWKYHHGWDDAGSNSLPEPDWPPWRNSIASYVIYIMSVRGCRANLCQYTQDFALFNIPLKAEEVCGL